MKVRLVYFAQVRETLGIDTEDRDLPDDVHTVSDCTIWLMAQGENYAAAFADQTRLRFALDQRMVPTDAALGGASELAIFPPVTGG